MRLIGLTLCLLASSLGARASSVEDRVSALEARVKVLEAALQAQGKSLPGTLDGTYTGTVGNGPTLVLELASGKAVASVNNKDTKTGTYKVDGSHLIVDIDNEAVTFEIEGDHLKAKKGDEKFDLVKVAPSAPGDAAAPATLSGAYKATLPNGEAITVEFDNGKATASSAKESKTGTYEIIGTRVVVTVEGKAETLVIDGEHLRASDGDHKIDFIKTK